MLSNYWQSYLAGEKYYMVGVNGRIQTDEDKNGEARGIKELRLYEVDKIPQFIRKSGAEERFIPWSKETLEDRLYKSLSVIYNKVVNAPTDTEFMFVKYNEIDPPVHDVDGSITGPYLLASRQLILEGLPSNPNPESVKHFLKFIHYKKLIETFEEREFSEEDIPKIEFKGRSFILTFKEAGLAKLFLLVVGGLLKGVNFPVGCGIDKLRIKKVTMSKPVAPRSENASPGRNSNCQQQQSWRNSNSNHAQQQSWRNANYQQQQSWRSFNHHQQLSSRNTNNQQQQPGSSNMNDDRSHNYNAKFNVPPNKRVTDRNWRQN